MLCLCCTSSFWFAAFLLLTLQDFYEDLFEELSKYGEIESLNICDNLADHMVTCLVLQHFTPLAFSLPQFLQFNFISLTWNLFLIGG